MFWFNNLDEHQLNIIQSDILPYSYFAILLVAPCIISISIWFIVIIKNASHRKASISGSSSSSTLCSPVLSTFTRSSASSSLLATGAIANSSSSSSSSQQYVSTTATTIATALTATNSNNNLSLDKQQQQQRDHYDDQDADEDEEDEEASKENDESTGDNAIDGAKQVQRNKRRRGRISDSNQQPTTTTCASDTSQQTTTASQINPNHGPHQAAAVCESNNNKSATKKTNEHNAALHCGSKLKTNDATTTKRHWPTLDLYLIVMNIEEIINSLGSFSFAIISLIKPRNLFTCNIILFSLITTKLMQMFTLTSMSFQSALKTIKIRKNLSASAAQTRAAMMRRPLHQYSSHLGSSCSLRVNNDSDLTGSLSKQQKSSPIYVNQLSSARADSAIEGGRNWSSAAETEHRDNGEMALKQQQPQSQTDCAATKQQQVITSSDNKQQDQRDEAKNKKKEKGANKMIQFQSLIVAIFLVSSACALGALYARLMPMYRPLTWRPSQPPTVTSASSQLSSGASKPFLANRNSGDLSAAARLADSVELDRPHEMGRWRRSTRVSGPSEHLSRIEAQPLINQSLIVQSSDQIANNNNNNKPTIGRHNWTQQKNARQLWSSLMGTTTLDNNHDNNNRTLHDTMTGDSDTVITVTTLNPLHAAIAPNQHLMSNSNNKNNNNNRQQQQQQVGMGLFGTSATLPTLIMIDNNNNAPSASSDGSAGPLPANPSSTTTNNNNNIDAIDQFVTTSQSTGSTRIASSTTTTAAADEQQQQQQQQQQTTAATGNGSGEQVSLFGKIFIEFKQLIGLAANTNKLTTQNASRAANNNATNGQQRKQQQSDTQLFLSSLLSFKTHTSVYYCNLNTTWWLYQFKLFALILYGSLAVITLICLIMIECNSVIIKRKTSGYLHDHVGQLSLSHRQLSDILGLPTFGRPLLKYPVAGATSAANYPSRYNNKTKRTSCTGAMAPSPSASTNSKSSSSLVSSTTIEADVPAGKYNKKKANCGPHETGSSAKLISAASKEQFRRQRHQQSAQQLPRSKYNQKCLSNLRRSGALSADLIRPGSHERANSKQQLLQNCTSCSQTDLLQHTSERPASFDKKSTKTKLSLHRQSYHRDEDDDDIHDFLLISKRPAPALFRHLATSQQQLGASSSQQKSQQGASTGEQVSKQMSKHLTAASNKQGTDELHDQLLSSTLCSSTIESLDMLAGAGTGASSAAKQRGPASSDKKLDDDSDCQCGATWSPASTMSNCCNYCGRLAPAIIAGKTADSSKKKKKRSQVLKLKKDKKKLKNCCSSSSVKSQQILSGFSDNAAATGANKEKNCAKQATDQHINGHLLKFATGNTTGGRLTWLPLSNAATVASLNHIGFVNPINEHQYHHTDTASQQHCQDATGKHCQDATGKAADGQPRHIATMGDIAHISGNNNNNNNSNNNNRSASSLFATTSLHNIHQDNSLYLEEMAGKHEAWQEFCLRQRTVSGTVLFCYLLNHGPTMALLVATNMMPYMWNPILDNILIWLTLIEGLGLPLLLYLLDKPISRSLRRSLSRNISSTLSPFSNDRSQCGSWTTIESSKNRKKQFMDHEHHLNYNSASSSFPNFSFVSKQAPSQSYHHHRNFSQNINLSLNRKQATSGALFHEQHGGLSSSLANVNISQITLAQQQQLKQQGALIDRHQYNYQAANVVTMTTASPAKTGNGLLAATCKLFHISSSTSAMSINNKPQSTTRFKLYNPTNHAEKLSSSSSPSHLNNYNNGKVNDKKLMLHRSGNDKLSPTSSLSTLIRKFNYENYNNILQQYQRTTGIKMNNLNYKPSNGSTLSEEDHLSAASNTHHQMGDNENHHVHQQHQTKIGRNGQSRYETSSSNDFRVNHSRQPLNLDQLNNLTDDKVNQSRISQHKNQINFFGDVENRSGDSKSDIDSLKLVAGEDKRSCRNDQKREVYGTNSCSSYGDTKINNNGNKNNDKTDSGISNNNQNNINNYNKNKLLMEAIHDSKVNNESRQQSKINQTASQSNSNISNSISDQTLLELNNIKCRKGGLFYNYPPPKITHDGESSRTKNEATIDSNHNNSNNGNNKSDDKTKVTNFTFDSTISTTLDSHSSTLQKEETSNGFITKPGLDRLINSGNEVINKQLSQNSGKPSSGYNDYRQINLIDSQEPQIQQQDMKVSQPIKKTAVGDNKTGNVTRSHTSNSIIYNFDNNSSKQQARVANSTNILSNNKPLDLEATVTSNQWNHDKPDGLKEFEQKSAHDRNSGLQEGNKLSSIRQFVDNIRVLTMEAEINGSLSLSNNNSVPIQSQFSKQRNGVDPVLLLCQDDGQWEERFEDMSLCSDAMSMISASSEFEYYNIEDSLMIDMKRCKPDGMDKNDAKKGPQLKSHTDSAGISGANGKNKRLSFTKSKKPPTPTLDKDNMLEDTRKIVPKEDKPIHPINGQDEKPFLVHKPGLQGQQQQKLTNVQQPKKGDDRMPSFLNSPANPGLAPQLVSSPDNRLKQNQSRQQNQPRKSRVAPSGSGDHSTSSSSNSAHSQVNPNHKSQPSLSAIFNANKALTGSNGTPSHQQQLSSNNSKHRVQHAQQLNSSQNNREKTKLPGLAYLNDNIKTTNHLNNTNSPLAQNALPDGRRSSSSSTSNNDDNNRPLPLVRKDAHSNDIDKCKPPVAIVSASANDSRNVNNLLPLGNVRARIKKMESFSVTSPFADQMSWLTNGQEQQLLESQSSQNKALAPTMNKGLVPPNKQNNQMMVGKNSVTTKQAPNNTNNQQSTNNHNNTRLPNHSQIPHAITSQNTSSTSNLSSSAKLLMRTNNTNYINNKTNSTSDLHKPKPSNTTNHVTAASSTIYSSDNNIGQSYQSKANQQFANGKLVSGMAPLNSGNQQSQIQRNISSTSGPNGRNISHNNNHSNQSNNYYKSANNSNKKYTNNHLATGGNREDAPRNVSNNQHNINNKKSSVW